MEIRNKKKIENFTQLLDLKGDKRKTERKINPKISDEVLFNKKTENKNNKKTPTSPKETSGKTKHRTEKKENKLLKLFRKIRRPLLTSAVRRGVK